MNQKRIKKEERISAQLNLTRKYDNMVLQNRITQMHIMMR